MYYDALSRNTVKITLTSKDMKDYAIKSETLRARTAESKRSLTCFLKRFQSESSLFPDHKAERLFLEAFPSDDGGCVMYVSTLGSDTLSPVSSPVSERKTACMMCITSSLGDAVGLCRGIPGRVRTSAFYRLDGDYCLILKVTAGETEVIARAAKEYGEISDDITDIAYALEHGTVICASNAVKTLSKL